MFKVSNQDNRAYLNNNFPLEGSNFHYMHAIDDISSWSKM